jgi:hypothetical protein
VSPTQLSDPFGEVLYSSSGMPLKGIKIYDVRLKKRCEKNRQILVGFGLEKR